MLIYGKQEVIVILYENICKHVECKESIGSLKNNNYIYNTNIFDIINI